MMLLAGLWIGGCSNNEDTTPQSKPFVDPKVAEVFKGTQSPGDVWTWNLDKEQKHMTASWDHGTFDNTGDDVEIEGTFETLPSGFLKVTITKATPVSDEVKTDGSAWFYALEIPGMALVVKPEGSIKGDIIAMVSQGECADIPGTYNYIISAPGNITYDPITSEAFGYLELAQSGSGFNVSGYKFSLDCINGGKCSETGVINGIPSGKCTEGGEVVISSGGNTVAQGQFTQGGVMMMDFGFGNGGVFALEAGASATKASLQNNTYVGIAYMPKNNDDDKTMAVKLEFIENKLGNMVGVGNPFSDIENNLLNLNEGATVLVDNVVNGRVTGTMNFDEDVDVSGMAAALLVKGNDQILILTSYDEGHSNPFILILAKQN